MQIRSLSLYELLLFKGHSRYLLNRKLFLNFD